jgi:DNA-binding LacI/PurR family transcriptional regulator
LSSEILSQGDSYVIVPCENTSILHEIFFDGVFTFAELNRELLRKISPLPTIAFNNFSLHKDRLWSVVSDDEEMSRRAVNYFYSKGHRSIGLWILPDTHNFSDIRREKYFRQAIAELGLKPYIYYWGMGELEESEFTLMVKDKVTAVFLPGEFAYLQLDLMLKAANHRIPEQFSLIMLENRRFTPYIEPPLTTFEQDFRQMSKQALALAKQIANGASGILRNQKIPYLFHERSSVAEISQSC